MRVEKLLGGADGGRSRHHLQGEPGGAVLVGLREEQAEGRSRAMDL